MRETEHPMHGRRDPATRGFMAALAPALMAALTAAPASAATLDASRLHGHVSFGYAHLFAADAPGGSLSVGAGVDYPIGPGLRLGTGLGYSLLGSRTVVLGSQSANLDYSLLEGALLLHWEPSGLGPIGRISVGPGVASARAELATSGGGIEFTPLAREEVVPAAAIEATLIRRAEAPVRAGLELAARVAFLESETWTVASARLAIHY